MSWMLLCVLLAAPADPAPEAVTLTGQVVLLAEALPPGWKVDAEPRWIARPLDFCRYWSL